MKILFLALEPPYPPTKGHCVRTWEMLRALAADGHSVWLTGVTGEAGGVPIEAALREKCVEAEMFPAARYRLGRLRALFSPLPYGAWRFRCPALVRRVRELAAREGFDLVLCDGVYNTVNLPPELAVPVALNKDDVAHVIVGRYLRHERNPLKRVYAALEYRKLLRWEGQACAGVTRVLACSEADRTVLEATAPGARVAVVPNVIDTEACRPPAAWTDDGRTAVYVGAMDWYPNRDAVEFFAAEVLPLVRRTIPEARLVVAGRDPGGAARRRFRDRPEIAFTGAVPDIRDVLARSTLSVVPLRIGSGTRIKILEACAMGHPVVSTTIGAEGLELADGEHLLIADRPADFAAAVARLMLDPVRRQRMGRAARERIVRSYGPGALAAALRAQVAELAAAERLEEGVR